MSKEQEILEEKIGDLLEILHNDVRPLQEALACAECCENMKDFNSNIAEAIQAAKHLVSELTKLRKGE